MSVGNFRNSPNLPSLEVIGAQDSWSMAKKSVNSGSAEKKLDLLDISVNKLEKMVHKKDSNVSNGTS